MSKVSVILNTFNRPAMLKQAVASVLCQTLDNWQLVIAIDYPVGTRNETTRYCEDLVTHDHRILLQRTDLDPSDFSVNRFAHNINRAFQLCDGEYISYLCDDDLYVPWRLSVLSQALDDHKDWDVVYGSQVTYHIQNRTFEERELVGITREPALRIDHNSVMHRRHCFNVAGGWDETMKPRFSDGHFFQMLATWFAFYPVDNIGEVHRVGEHNGWSGKVLTDNEKKAIGTMA